MTGILVVPAHHRVFASAAGNHEVVAIDDQTLKVVGRAGDIRFPDGIAYAPVEQKVFVSDESGDADVVIDARTNKKRSTIELGGEAGNTHYDSVSHCILIAVQTRNQLVAIDPATEKIVERYDLRGSDHPHGFTIDERGRLAFISNEGNGKLLVVDLRAMQVMATYTVGDDPDVLAWDPTWRRLYVAPEGGVLSSFSPTVRSSTPSGKSGPHMRIRYPWIPARIAFISHPRTSTDIPCFGFRRHELRYAPRARRLVASTQWSLCRRWFIVSDRERSRA